MMNQEKIQKLIVRSRREDTNAFSLLLSEFQSLAFRLLCDEDEAEDMVQKTLRHSPLDNDAGYSCY